MNIIRFAFIIAFSTVFTTPAFALSSDRDQPAEVEAEDITFDFKTGTRTYRKDVLIVQGTLRIKADLLKMHYTGNELKEAVATGSLARFKQRPDGKEDDVEGWAEKIIVDQRANTLTLIGQASLRQGPNTARGKTIIYNMANDTLRLKGSANVGAKGKAGEKPAPTRSAPFDANNQGPEAPARKPHKPKQTKAAVESSTTTNEAVVDAIDEKEDEPKAANKPQYEYVPTRKGRSRLIIQPQKPDDSASDEKTDSEEED